MSTFSEPIFVGIDVSKATLDVAYRGVDKTQQYANTEEGVRTLLKHLSADKEHVAVLMEATGGLERLSATTLCLAGYAVMVVNPRQAHDFAKALGYLSKTDATDAKALSQFAYTLRLSKTLFRNGWIFSPGKAGGRRVVGPTLGRATRPGGKRRRL